MPRNAETEPRSFQEYWQVLRRRRYLFAIPAVVILLAATYYALTRPEIYRSQATILIENYEIPEDIAGALIGNYASQEIQLISQRILTVSNISDIVNKFDVYGASATPTSSAKIASWFRVDMELDLVSTEVFDSRGRSGESAIAFTLAFNNEDPRIAQEVTEELVALFLNENGRASATAALGVSKLLAASIAEANNELLAAELKVAEFKTANEGALPELYQLNFDIISRTEHQLVEANNRIKELEQRKLELSAQISTISPSAPVTLPSGETIASDRDRLAAALVEYSRKSAIYESGHPDLMRLKREIDTLQASMGDVESESYELLVEQLQAERARLAGLIERYSVSHPDVMSAESSVTELERQLAELGASPAKVQPPANNPAYVLLQTQIQAIDLEIRSLLAERENLQTTIAKHESHIRQAPQVEIQYTSLSRDYENARAKYSDLQQKLRAAQVAANLEQEIEGGQFTLLEPPDMPIEPLPRNQFAILVMGLIFALGVGIGIVVIVESLDNSVRGEKGLVAATGAPPLAVIPYIDNAFDLGRQRVRRMTSRAAVISIGAIVCAYFLYLA